jgi:DUF4097 and DUF4098 domain-containing protein YvlB
MPTFKTPQPITVVLDLQNADIRIAASDRKDTVVDVQARDAGTDIDDVVRVEFVAGRLSVSSRNILAFLPVHRRDALGVSIALPAGSRVQGSAAMGDLRADGKFGDCLFKAGKGDVAIDRIAGEAQITSGFGAIRIGQVEGNSTIKSATGDTHIGEAGGEVRVSAANGDVTIGRTQGVAVLRTANGDIRIDEVARGSVNLETANGALEIGIREGTAAWLDVKTHHGNIRNSMSTENAQGQAKETAEIRGRTANGDIIVRRSRSASGKN